MINMYDAMKVSLQFDKFEVQDLLFAQYTCPLQEPTVGIWTPCDSFVHVLSGRKTWVTPNETWTAEPGQTLFLKRGAAIAQQHFEEQFCVLRFYVGDDFVRECVREIGDQMPKVDPATEPMPRSLRLKTDPTLDAYFQAMLAFFTDNQQPSQPMLILKLKELMYHVLLKDRNPSLTAHFQQIATCQAPSLRQLMEENFTYDLSIEEFARLSNRSLSSFKRDFQTVFNMSPGKWLLDRRLDYAADLLTDPQRNVTQVAFDSGFNDVSHFSRSFKNKFGHPPAQSRKRVES